MITITSPDNLLYGVVYLIDNKPIDPKFLNMLRAAIEGGQAQNLARGMDNPSLLNSLRLEAIVDPEADGMKLVARRINLGSLGGFYTVTLNFPKNPRFLWTVGTAQALVNFGRSMLDVNNTKGGNVVFETYPLPKQQEVAEYPAAFEDFYDEDEEFGDYLQERVSPPKPARVEDIRLQASEQVKRTSAKLPSVEYEKSTSAGLALSALNIIERQETDEINQLERERIIALEQLKAAILNYVITFNADPTGIVRERLEGKYILTQTRSPLVVNGDLKLVLPAYNETPINMPALCRTIYLLFLKHQHEGIILKHIGDYRQEIEEIYAMVMPGRDEALASAAIDTLCDPLSNTLTQYISKINRCINNVILNKEIAEYYHIKGRRGEPYSIKLDSDMITLPAAIL